MAYLVLYSTIILEIILIIVCPHQFCDLSRTGNKLVIYAWWSDYNIITFEKAKSISVGMYFCEAIYVKPRTWRVFAEILTYQ